MRTVLLCLAVAWLSRGVAALPKALVLRHIEAAQASPEAAFRQWAIEHDRPYLNDPIEYQRRFAIWNENVDYIDAYNKKHDKHWLGLTLFADRSHSEFQERSRGYEYSTQLRLDAAKEAQGLLSAAPFKYADVPEADLPAEVDWREKGAVTGVKNQASCGSCWAFSTTGAVEGVNAIYTGKLDSLSEQELIDCDVGNDHGCSGGLMDYAFQFIIDNGGIDTEKDYAYMGQDGQCSLKKRGRNVVTIDAFQDVPHSDPLHLRRAVAHQPIAVAIQANERPFQLYAGGVLTDDCGTALDHGVLLVGYGTENGTDYWLVKNSWSAAWGDGGYIKIERDAAPGPGKCGVQLMPSFPIKEHDNPPRPPRPAPDPPSPPPSPPKPPPGKPVQCDASTECAAGTTCCCMQELLGMCLQWACCPMPKATCCEDKMHCCPADLPVCDVAHGRCLPSDAASYLDARSQAMQTKVPATRRFARGGAGAIRSFDA